MDIEAHKIVSTFNVRTAGGRSYYCERIHAGGRSYYWSIHASYYCEHIPAGGKYYCEHIRVDRVLRVMRLIKVRL